MNHSILQSTGIFSLDFSERRAQCHFFSFFFISERKMSENTSFPTINRQRSGKKVLSIRVQNFGERERERERAARSLARLKIKKEPLAFARVHFPKHQLASSSSSRASPGNSRADFEEFRWTKVLYLLISVNCD